MKYRKGFTLIELLAVIVILAVLALIIIPVISNVISEARISADLRSAEGYVSAAKNYYANSTLKNSPLDVNVIDSLELSSKKASDGSVVIVNSDGTIDMAIIINDRCYKKTASQSIKDIEVSEDLDNCTMYSNIYAVVKNAFPELELGDNGCKEDTENNYTYMGGCYLSGPQTSNYLWYSGFLWRILGINADKTVKLITEENVTAIPYNNINFLTSTVSTWLDDFYTKIKDNSIVVSSDFCQGAVTSEVLNRTDCSTGTIINHNVGLLSMDEYSMSFNKTTYLNNSQYFWMMSPYGNGMYLAYSSGAGGGDLANSYGVRPVINVKANTSVTSGNGLLAGTWDDTASPYVLDENKSRDITGYLKDKAAVGEYVNFANQLYRVVNIDSDGNTKLIFDGYLKNEDGSNYKSALGADNSLSSWDEASTQILNGLVSTDEQSKLVDYTWYQGVLSWGGNYLNSMNETSPKQTFNAKVGFIRIGEMLAGQSYTLLTKGGTVSSSYTNTTDYWTMTASSSSTGEWMISGSGRGFGKTTTDAYSIRPCLVVNSSVQITSGSGTPSSPYQI